MTPLLGLGHLEPEVGGQRLLDHREHRLGHRAGDRIHHEEEPLEAHGHAVSMTNHGSVAPPISPPRRGAAGRPPGPPRAGCRGRHARRRRPPSPTAATAANRSPYRADSASTTSPTDAPSASTRARTRQLAERGEQPNGHVRASRPRLSPARAGLYARGVVIRDRPAHRSHAGGGPARALAPLLLDLKTEHLSVAAVADDAGARTRRRPGRRRREPRPGLRRAAGAPRAPIRGPGRWSSSNAATSTGSIGRRSRTTLIYPGAPEGEIRLRFAMPGAGRARARRTTIRLGPIALDTSTYRVSVEGRPLDLTFKEFELLRYLAERRGTGLHAACAAPRGLGVRLLRRDADGRRPRPAAAREARTRARGPDRDRPRRRVPRRRRRSAPTPVRGAARAGMVRA